MRSCACSSPQSIITKSSHPGLLKHVRILFYYYFFYLSPWLLFLYVEFSNSHMLCCWAPGDPPSRLYYLCLKQMLSFRSPHPCTLCCLCAGECRRGRRVPLQPARRVGHESLRYALLGSTVVHEAQVSI